MRLIDANQLLDKAICTRNYFEIKSLVESIPILNEPHCDLLSLGELMSMDGEPIWLEVGPSNEWVIVHSHDPEDVIGGGITVITKAREKLLLQYDKWLTTWKAYCTKQEENLMTNNEAKRNYECGKKQTGAGTAIVPHTPGADAEAQTDAMGTSARVWRVKTASRLHSGAPGERQGAIGTRETTDTRKWRQAPLLCFLIGRRKNYGKSLRRKR